MNHLKALSSPTHLPERLPFRLHDFTRFAWVSDEARAVWEQRIHRVTDMLFEIETEAIAEGNRKCALRSLTVEQMDKTRTTLAARGIGLVVLQPIRMSSSYSSTLEPCRGETPTAYWCALGIEPFLPEMGKAFHDNDQRTIGRLLAYPDCCNDFFQRTWVDAGMVDTTWPMAAATTSARRENSHSIVIDATSLCGMQLRWLGVRAVFHLPCACDCEPSIALAQQHLKLAAEAGFTDEVDWLRKMLAWPVEWSALHGIAEVRSPVVKIVTRTDATPAKYTVRYQGHQHGIPQEAGTGLVFPFNRGIHSLITKSKSFQLGLQNTIESGSDDPLRFAPWYCADNGFASRYSMDRAHGSIVDVAKELISRQAPPRETNLVFDFGCGNGVLIRKIAQLDPRLQPGGIDFDADKIAHARLVNNSATQCHFRTGDMFESELLERFEPIYLVFLMVGRLTEVSRESAQELLARIRSKAQHLIVYAYDDYITTNGSVEAMAVKVGLPLMEGTPAANVRLADLKSLNVNQGKTAS
jgi:hypothetical protein